MYAVGGSGGHEQKMEIKEVGLVEDLLGSIPPFSYQPPVSHFPGCSTRVLPHVKLRYGQRVGLCVDGEPGPIYSKLIAS